MENKKRDPRAPQNKDSPATLPVTYSYNGGTAFVPHSHLETFQAVSDLLNTVCSDLALIKLECEKALTAFHVGNHNRALEIIQDLCSKHEGSPYEAFTQRAHGLVLFELSKIIDDPDEKQRHLKKALDFARRATELSPNSLEFALFYGNLLLEVATEADDFEEVVKECERALAVKNPNDPAKEKLQDEIWHKSWTSTARSRIAHARNQLQQLIQKTNIAALGAWMKTLSFEGTMMKPIAVSRPIFILPDAIKKGSMTPEERSKEIEARVAAAKLSQQKSESTQSPTTEGDRALDQSSGSSSESARKEEIKEDNKKHIKMKTRIELSLL